MDVKLEIEVICWKGADNNTASPRLLNLYQEHSCFVEYKQRYSTITSRIDNCNSLLYGVLASNLSKLQNACARLIYIKTNLNMQHHFCVSFIGCQYDNAQFSRSYFQYSFFQKSVPVYLMESLHVSERCQYNYVKNPHNQYSLWRPSIFQLCTQTLEHPSKPHTIFSIHDLFSCTRKTPSV